MIKQLSSCAALSLLLVLPACNTDVGEKTKNSNEEALGLVIGDEGNFATPTPAPAP